jgi:hypothetical protein
VLDQQLHHLIGGLGIFFFEAEFLPHAVSPHQAGHGIFELRDDVAQCGFIGWVLDVQNDVALTPNSSAMLTALTLLFQC